MRPSRLTMCLVASIVVGCTAGAISPPQYTHHTSPAGVVPEVVPVWIDKRFTSAHRAAVHEAFAQWNTALNGYESFSIVSDTFDMETATIEQIDFTGQGLLVLSRMHGDPILEDLPEGVLGWVSTDLQSEAHVLNLIEDAIGNRDLVSITAHEIGHTLRLPHLPVKWTLMFPSYRYGSPCVDQFTVQALATARGWQWKSMNWCFGGNS